MLLEISNLTKSFGGVTAVNNLTLKIEKKTILGLIGPNGAGKTTFVNLISGLEKPDAGEIYYRGKRITGLSPYKIAQMGMVRTYQITKVFKRMSTIENLYVPVIWQHKKLNVLKKRANELLETFNLAHLKHIKYENISISWINMTNSTTNIFFFTCL